MAQAAVTTKVHQALDIHRGFAPEIAFDHVVSVDYVAYPGQFVIAEVVRPDLAGDVCRLADFHRGRAAYTEDVGERDRHRFVGQVYTRNACHDAVSLAFKSLKL